MDTSKATLNLIEENETILVLKLAWEAEPLHLLVLVLFYR
jgi:hypothetical protein